MFTSKNWRFIVSCCNTETKINRTQEKTVTKMADSSFRLFLIGLLNGAGH